MSEKINSLNLCVCMALADHGLGKDETAEILKIAKEIKVDFNVHNATDEIKIADIKNKFFIIFLFNCNINTTCRNTYSFNRFTILGNNCLNLRKAYSSS